MDIIKNKNTGKEKKSKKTIEKKNMSLCNFKSNALNFYIATNFALI